MTPEKILSIARAELGYREGADNDNKYGQEYGLNGQPWCVIFQWWCFKHAGAGELFPNTAHCDGVRSFAKGIGRWYNHAEIGEGIDLQPGDLVIWDYDNDGSGDHIGIIETAKNNLTFTTLEGNYSDAVCRVNRDLTGVSGIYRPKYESIEAGAEETETEEPETSSGRVYETFPTLAHGSTGAHVFLLQAKLAVLSYNTGDIDGEVGPITMAALSRFQADAGLDADGICGQLTWAALWERGV